MIVVNSYFDSLFYVYFLWRKEQKAQNHQSRFQKFRHLLLGGARAKKIAKFSGLLRAEYLLLGWRLRHASALVIENELFNDKTRNVNINLMI